MKNKLLAAMALSVVFVSGCATNETRNQENYQTYVKAVTDAQAAKTNALQVQATQRNTQFAASAAACNGDKVCVATVASYQALASVVDSLSTQNSSNAINLQAPQREPSMFEKIAPVLGMALPVLGNAYAVHENVKAQISGNETNAQVQIANTNAWSNAVNSVASHPTTYVGGNYGDTYGDNYTGGNRTDNSGTLVNGNQNRLGSANTGGAGGNCNGGPGGASGAGTGASSGTGGAGGNNGGTAGSGGPGTSGSAGGGGAGGNCSGGPVSP